MSIKVIDLVKDELDIEEDLVLANSADRRMTTFDRKAAKTHAEIWGNAVSSNA